jgi:hypothetical protein
VALCDYIVIFIVQEIRLIYPNTLRVQINPRNRAIKLPIAIRLIEYILCDHSYLSYPPRYRLIPSLSKKQG